MKTLVKLSAVMAMVALVVSASPAAAKYKYKGWVPSGAWKAVKAYAKANLNNDARLFKTAATKQDSRGLKGSQGRAYIVGARTKAKAGIGMPPIGPGPGIWMPQQTRGYYLVAKKGQQWKVTELAGMGQYKHTVDARADKPKVFVGVEMAPPATVGHGVEIKNVSRTFMARGTVLAQKKVGGTQTVFVKGTSPMKWAHTAKANIIVQERNSKKYKAIPVSFDQVMYAQ